MWWWWVACVAVQGGSPRDRGSDTGAPAATDTATAPTPPPTTGALVVPDAGDGCAPSGTFACPIPVGAVPYVDPNSTEGGASEADSYACAPTTDESGPERVYRITLARPALLGVAVDADPGVDVDVHLLSAPDPAACRTRDHLATGWYAEAGVWYLVADSWVDGSGTPLSGGYTLTVQARELTGTACAVSQDDLAMYWDACAPGIACDDSAGTPTLHLPSVGPVVKEAHLVTVEETFPNDWPTSFTDAIDRHYALSEAASGYAMARTEPWAPSGEGGSRFGQGATGAPLPVEDEAWYVNLYWRDRPAGGTRMLVVDPLSGAAVVASGGWETGPGDAAMLGGAVEEIHDAVGTVHEDKLLFAFLDDQTLPLGPIACW